MQYVLHTPLQKSDLAPLHAGDTVLLSGVVYTARDAAHARMMELLDEKERQLVEMRYFKDMTQSAIADELGMSQVQVSRLEKKILRFLREKL